NGIMDPGEEPGLANADQVVWFVANDLSVSATRSLAGSPPIGLELQGTLWAYDQKEALGNVIFKHYRLIYKGTASTPDTAHIDSMYLGQWADPDLGTYTDDFAGIDTTLALAYAYNSSSQDQLFDSFNLPPPAVGYDFLSGPIVPGEPSDMAIFDFVKRTGFKNLPMTSFTYRGIAAPEEGCLGSYECTLEFWNMLRGYLPFSDPSNPEPYRTATGEATRFPLSGDPVTGTGDLDGVLLPPGDRRFLISSGPFTMALGDTQEVIIALVTAMGGDYLSSVAILRLHALSVKNVYKNSFQPPAPPDPPELQVSALNNMIVLNWGEQPSIISKTENQIHGGFIFEGYNVYQFPSKDALLQDSQKIATFDRVNKVTTIMESFVDPQTGLILQRPIQVGHNSGIKRFLIVTSDYILDQPIINNRPYHFAVTAYNYNPDDPLQPSLESAPIVQTVIPHAPKPGVRYGHAVGDTLNVQPKTSDPVVIPIVIDPSRTTGDIYRVQILKNTHGQPFWNLFNQSKNTVIVQNQTNFSGDEDYPLTDGILVKVLNAATDSSNFLFSTKAPRFDVRLAKMDVERVNVFPNPYIGFNKLETSRFHRFVTFTHLPRKATIRIFNLAGTLVKTIHKDDDSTFVRWNLTNEANFIVASCLYLAHIEMPELGKSKVLKLVIIMEQLY
ncbi:MAG: hypothetical protein D6813_09165, partial [Calditrichaeota bacterium]